jgi:hypothetical protein
VFTNLAWLVGLLDVLENPWCFFIWISASIGGVTTHKGEVCLDLRCHTVGSEEADLYLSRSRLKRCAPVQSHEAERHESRNDSGDSTSLRPGMQLRVG